MVAKRPLQDTDDENSSSLNGGSASARKTCKVAVELSGVESDPELQDTVGSGGSNTTHSGGSASATTAGGGAVETARIPLISANLTQRQTATALYLCPRWPHHSHRPHSLVS